MSLDFSKMNTREEYYNAQRIGEQEKYGALVKVNTYTDKMRRNECMCLYCTNLKPGQPDNCPAAQKMYDIAVQYDCAMMMTRCKNYEPGRYFDGRKK